MPCVIGMNSRINLKICLISNMQIGLQYVAVMWFIAQLLISYFPGPQSDSQNSSMRENYWEMEYCLVEGNT